VVANGCLSRLLNKAFDADVAAVLFAAVALEAVLLEGWGRLKSRLRPRR
jgi:hypothetical protein